MDFNNILLLIAFIPLAAIILPLISVLGDRRLYPKRLIKVLLITQISLLGIQLCGLVSYIYVNIAR